jgi:hypothetical protein
MSRLIFLTLTTVGLALLRPLTAVAQPPAATGQIYEGGTFKTYLRLLAAEGDHAYVLGRKQCFQELSLRERVLRPVVARCPRGDIVEVFLSTKRFYWTQDISKGLRSVPRLYTCEREHCVPRLLGVLSSFTGIYQRDGQVYASFATGPKLSTVVRIDEESGNRETLATIRVPIYSLMVDGTDLYYYNHVGQSEAIWRKSMADNRRPETVVALAGNPPLLFARDWEEAEEIERLPLMGHPHTSSFERLVEVDGDRLYWEAQGLYWYSKSKRSLTNERSVGEFTDSDGKRLDAGWHLLSTPHYFYFVGSDKRSILRVAKRGGRPETVAVDTLDISEVSIGNGLLVWSSTFEDSYGATTTIRWTTLSAEN